MITLQSIARALDISHRNKAAREARSTAEADKQASARRAREQQLEDERLAFLTMQIVRRTH